MREVTRKYRVFLLALILAQLVLPHITTVRADIATIEEVNTGACFCMNENVSMPMAIVNVSINSLGPITINSTFALESRTVSEYRIGFLYPSRWHSYTHTNDLGTLEVSIDGDQVEYEIKNGLQLNMSIEDYWMPTDELNFAVFNVSFAGNLTRIVRASAILEPDWRSNRLLVDYYVGSASSWANDTHEIVTMKVQECSQLQSYSFYPDQNLTIVIDGDNAFAEWDFFASDFNRDWISFSADVNEKFVYFPPPDPVIPLAIGAVVVFALALFCTIKNIPDHR